MGIIRKLRSFKQCMIPSRSDFGTVGRNAIIGFPVYITNPQAVHIEENAVIRLGAKILNSEKEHIYIGKYTVVGVNCVIVANGHRSTVGIPHVLLGASHINDKSQDIRIGEDVWIGANVTIMPGANLGRGCIVGACSTVTKPVPPYALVVGSPARIIGVKFNIEHILEHERTLYSSSERISRKELDELFAKYYEGMKEFGVQTEFTEDDLVALETAKRLRGFIEPKIDDDGLENTPPRWKIIKKFHCIGGNAMLKAA